MNMKGKKNDREKKMTSKTIKKPAPYPHGAQTVDDLEKRVVEIQRLEPHEVPNAGNHVDEKKGPGHVQGS